MTFDSPNRINLMQNEMKNLLLREVNPKSKVIYSTSGSTDYSNFLRNQNKESES